MKHAIMILMLLGMVVPAWAMEPVVAPVRPAVPAAATPPAPAAAAGEAAKKDADALEPAVQTTPSTTARRAQDRLELDTTQITGNRELPRVLYVVPWKRPDMGDVAGRPANSLLDEVLAPVDRDVFRRQNRYYQALKPDSAGAARTSGPEGEK